MNVTTEQLFDNARTQNGFTAEPVPESTLHQLYDMMKWGPTSANTSPARIVFVTSPCVIQHHHVVPVASASRSSHE